MPIKWIVFNGPQNSGRSKAALWLCRAIRGINERVTPLATRRPLDVRVDSFSAPMRHFIAAGLGEKYQDLDRRRARPELYGRSVHELEDNLAGLYLKDRFGPDVFARWLVHRNMKAIPQADYVIIDDGVYDEDRFALTKPRIIAIDRPGCVFAPGTAWWTEPWAFIVNDADHNKLYETVTHFARTILKEDFNIGE